MRFRFCGDLDCPDWVLAEISLLSKISSVKMKLFCQQIMNQILHGKIDFNKVSKFTADAKYELQDIKAAIATIDFIFTSAGKHNVDGDTLSNELQQLGLPKEITTSLCKVYGDKLDDLKTALHYKSLRLSKLKSIEWRVDYLLASSVHNELNVPEVQIKISKTNNEEKADEIFSFTTSGDKFRILLTEMKYVYKQMEDLS